MNVSWPANPAAIDRRGGSHRRGRLAPIALGTLVLLTTTCAVDPASVPSTQPQSGAQSPSPPVETPDGRGAGVTGSEGDSNSGGGGNSNKGDDDRADAASGSRDGGDGRTGGGTTDTGSGTTDTGSTAGDASDSAGGSGTSLTDSGSTAPVPPPLPPGPRFPEPLGVTLTRVAELPQPLALAFRPQEPGVIYVALRHGVVVRLRGGGGPLDAVMTALRIDGDPVLDISALVATEGEMGLLGLTFSPGGDRVYTSSVSPQQVSELWEWPVAADGSVDASRGRLVLSLSQPFWNHNGGDVTFGPDGHLYLAFGDGGGGGDPLRAGQDPHNWLGTVLRIDPRPGPAGEFYTIPADNPYADGAGGAPEVWLWGARNPWRISFDRATGDLWVADVGQDLLEEITRLPAAAGAGRGANLGWSDYEGSAPFWSQDEPPGHVRPTVEYRHGDDRRCSVTGGYVYRGRHLPGLTGVYLYSDFCDGTLWGYTAAAGAHPLLLTRGAAPFGAVLSFGEGPDGEIYVLTPEALWRLDAS